MFVRWYDAVLAFSRKQIYHIFQLVIIITYVNSCTDCIITLVVLSLMPTMDLEHAYVPVLIYFFEK